MRLAVGLMAAWVGWSTPADAQRAIPTGVTSHSVIEHRYSASAPADTVPRLKTERIVWGGIIGAVAFGAVGAMYELGQCESHNCERPVKGAVGGAIMGGVLGGLFGWLFAIPRAVD